MSRSIASVKSFLLVTGAVALLSMPASADTLEGVRGSVREVRHVVRLSFRDGAVIAKVRRSFKNLGERVDQLELTISLPPNATATGLRIKGAEKWHRGDLADARTASDFYRRLTGYRDSRFPPKDPALLHWGGDGELELKVFPVPLDGLATVEYTLTIAPDYEGGEYYVTLPLSPEGTNLVGPTIVLENEPPNGAGLFLGGEPVEAGERVRVVQRLPRRKRKLRHIEADSSIVAAFRTQGVGVEGRLGVVAVSSKTSLARLELDAMPKLTELPKKAQVVFVVDASRSAAEMLGSQLAMIKTFGRLLPDAEIEVVRFDRTAERIFDSFVSGAQLEQRLAAAVDAKAFAPRHGSNADRGLALAASLVQSRTGPRRIVLVSDERYRQSFPVADLERAARESQAVVHVLRAQESRDRAFHARAKGRFASVAHATGGLIGDLASLADHGDWHLDEALLELVRPVRLDDASVEFAGRSVQLGNVREGERALFFGLESKLADEAVVRGMLWTAPFEKRIAVDTGQTARTAAAAFSGADPLYRRFTPAQGRRVARAGRAVSPWTSYLAIEPGVRPSREGFGVEGGVAGGVLGGTIGGTLGGTNLGAPPPPPPPPGGDPYEGWWDVAACSAAVRPPKSWHVAFRLERTDDEIVALDVEKTNHEPMARCLADKAWQSPLPSRLPAGDHVDRRRVQR